jgi:hypothetical protein
MAFNSNQGGFSESVYCADPVMTQDKMMDKMQDVLNARLLLSQCNPAIGCENPIEPQFIRVEDELIERDAFTLRQFAPEGGWQGFTPNNQPAPDSTASQNLDLQLGPRVSFFSGAPRQEAVQLLHGLPVSAISQIGIPPIAPPVPAGQFPLSFVRNTQLLSTYKKNLEKYIGVLYDNLLGFRTITGIWNDPISGDPGPYSTPTSVFYNTEIQQVELQWATAPPNKALLPAQILAQVPKTFPGQSARVRVQIRGWRGFQVLNGRWAAQVVPAQQGSFFALRILRTCREPLTGNLPFVSPIAWTVWVPGAATAVLEPAWSRAKIIAHSWSSSDIDAKKLGRNFNEPRGRARNRPV